MEISAGGQVWVGLGGMALGKENEDHQELTLSQKPSSLSHIFSNLNELFPFCKQPLNKIMGA